MSKVFVSVSISLDGFTAPSSAYETMGKQWMQQWMQLQSWVFPTKTFRQRLKLGEDGETGEDDVVVRETFARTGVTIMGKRMFDAGEKSWPEEAPFHHPVFVCTHTVRAPWERPGGTTFHFVNDGIQQALARAREVAGELDIRIGGGADMIRQYLNAGLVDELHLAIAPMLMGAGDRLFDGVDPARFSLALEQGRVLHLRGAMRSSA